MSNIKLGKCVLFLGPNITMNYANPAQELEFLTKLADEHEGISIKDGFLVLDDEGIFSDIEPEVYSFYGQSFENPLLNKLARLPFSCYVVASPDLALNKAFDKHQMRYQHRVYEKKKKVVFPEKFDQDNPLIYSLLGCVSDKFDSSAILTHQDLFEYLETVYSSETAPDGLLNAITKSNTIIFLGFDFSKWYFQLLLYMLKINNNTKQKKTTTRENEHLTAPFDSLFNIKVSQEDMSTFVDTLYEHFEECELRQAAQRVRKYDYSKILTLMEKTLQGSSETSEFDTFCVQYFGELAAKRFTSDHDKAKRVEIIYKHMRDNGREAELLEAIRLEYPRVFGEIESYFVD